MTGTALQARMLIAAERDLEPTLSLWRYENRRARQFGRLTRVTPLPAMTALEAEQASETATDLYYRGIVSGEDLRDEIAAIEAARGEVV